VRVSPVILREPQGSATAILVVARDVTRYKQAEQLVRGIVSRIDAEPVSARSAEIAPMRPASDDTATMLRTCFPDLTQRESEVLGEAISGEGYQEIASTLGIRPTTARNYFSASSASSGCIRSGRVF
jgi:DNA-binding NarL/FixJ family response regulator